MQRFFFPSIVLSQAGRLGGEIQMIKYTKIAIFFEDSLSDSKKCSGLIRPTLVGFRLKGLDVASWVVKAHRWR